MKRAALYARISTPVKQAIRILERAKEQLPTRTIERDIVVCAILYLEGDLAPGGTVASWTRAQGIPEPDPRPQL